MRLNASNNVALEHETAHSSVAAVRQWRCLTWRCRTSICLVAGQAEATSLGPIKRINTLCQHRVLARIDELGGKLDVTAIAGSSTQFDAVRRSSPLLCL
jgi:hypothetical protein